MATGTNNIASVYDLWSTLDTLGDLSSTKTALTSVYGTYSSTAAPETKNQWGTGLCPSKASWLKLNDYNTNGIVEISGTYTNDQLVKYTDLIYKYLKLSVSTWNPSSSAETKTISVTCSGSFTVSSNQSWLTVSSTSGSGSKNITLSVTENTSIESFRSGAVTFVGDGITKTVNVKQDARNAVIAYELEISGETSVLVNKTIQLTATLYKTVDGVRTESTNVTNSCNWEVSTLFTYASVDNVSNKGLVTGLKNTYSSQATIKATYSSYSATYKIYVADDVSYEFAISSSVDEIQVGDNVTFTATLYTNRNGTVTESSKTLSCTWTENSNGTIVNKNSSYNYMFTGVSSGKATITATWTDSNGITYSDSKTITVKAADSIDISPKTLTIPASGESKTIIVAANNNWQISGIPSWITTNVSSGTGSSAVILSISANDSTSSRSATIKFTCGNSTSVNLSVTQAGKVADSISVTPTSWSPGSSVNSTYVSLTSSGAWTASSNQSWLTVGTTSGTSTTSKSIKLSVTENTTTSERTGTVTFTCGTATATVNVKQAGKTIESVVTYEIDLRFRDGYESSVYISKYTYFDVYLYTITDGVKDNGVKLNTLVLQNDVTWTVSDTNIVEPLEGYPYAYSGLVPGTTTITASYTYNNQTLTSSEIVTVLPSFINTDLSSYTFNAAGGTKDVIVTCSPNVLYVSVSEVDANGNSNSVSWLSNTKTTNDDGSFTYTLTCTENTSTNDRTVYVKFYSSLYDEPYKTVKITQSGAAEVVYTMTFTDFNQLLDCLNSNSSYYVASAYDWTIYDGDNYPEFYLSYDDGTIVGTLQQWTNLYNSIYDPEAESNQIVLINDDDQVVNVSNADFYTGIKSIVNSGNRFVSVEISPVCTMYMQDWETTVGEKLPEGDGSWELYSARDNRLDGGDYPVSYLYYFDGFYQNFIEGRIWQWCNLKNYVYNEFDNKWDSLKFINYDSGDETTNFDFDNFHDGVTHIINTTSNAYIRFFYETTGGGGSGSTSNTYTIPFNYRATDGVREVDGDFKVTIYSNNGNTYTSGWMSFAGGKDNGDDNHTHNIGSVTFTINGNDIGANNNIYFKVEYSDRSTKLGTRLQIREYFDSIYSVVGDKYYFDNYNWVADDSSSPYLQNGTFNFTDSLQNDPNGFIEFTFSDDV